MTTFPFLRRDSDWRNGEDRIFVRRRGRSIRLRAAEGTPEFAVEYARALETLANMPAKAKRVVVTPLRPGTMGALAANYYNSKNHFLRVDAVTQRRRRAAIESCLRTLHKGQPLRDCPVKHFTAAKIRALRDDLAHKPGAANNRLKHLSSMLGWAVEAGILASNPCRDVARISYATDGYHTWTPEELEQFERYYPIGTKARLAMALLRYLGVRRGDLVTLGRPHVKGNAITFVPRKTRHKRKTPSTKPILPVLARIIEESPTGELTFLQTDYGRPFTAAGFGNWFRDRCREAGLAHCSAHGLRKAAASKAAEEGATVYQLMAIFDWATTAQAEPYVQAANRTKMAADAMPLIVEVSHKRKKNKRSSVPRI